MEEDSGGAVGEWLPPRKYDVRTVTASYRAYSPVTATELERAYGTYFECSPP